MEKIREFSFSFFVKILKKKEKLHTGTMENWIYERMDDHHIWFDNYIWAYLWTSNACPSVRS